MKHQIHPHLLNKRVKVLLVGGGGTGSRVLENLMNLHRAMLALGHPQGLEVTLVDDDRVSSANVGRQSFYACDIGTYKAITLINRANMAMEFSTPWKAVVGKVTTKSTGIANYDIVIGAVDNRSARLAILRGLESAAGGKRYWLDLGNRAADGQVVLGEVTPSRARKDDPWRLPHAGEIFPQLIDTALDALEDDTPSCSLAQALEKQSLFINPAVSLFAANLLWQLFTKGEIEHHGAFVNLEKATVLPMEIDQEVWARFGVRRNGQRTKVQQPSRKVATTT